MSNVLLRGLFACVVTMVAQSCCTKNKCGSTIELKVLSADGSLMTQADGVKVEGPGKAEPCDEHATCSFRLPRPGDFTVSAEGYKPALVHVDVERDDCDNSLSQSIEVRMAAAQDAATPVIQRSAMDSC